MGIELLRNKFVSLKFSSSTGHVTANMGSSTQAHPLCVSWIPSDHSPWNFPQATVSGFAF